MPSVNILSFSGVLCIFFFFFDIAKILQKENRILATYQRTTPSLLLSPLSPPHTTAVHYHMADSPPEAASEAVHVNAPDVDDDSDNEYFTEETVWYRRPLEYPTVLRVWRAVEPVLYQMYVTADYLGEKVADALGVTESRFQYVIDEHDRQMRRKRKKEQYIRKKLLEEREKERKRLGLANPNAAATSLHPLTETVLDEKVLLEEEQPDKEEL